MTDTRSGAVAWRSPSNIAIVKYWGKHGEQLPANPSLSLTLSEAFTDTHVRYTPAGGERTIRFLFEGAENAPFAGRIERFIRRLDSELPALAGLDLEIGTTNSFPHSAGIASSASGLSALALCLCTIQEEQDGGVFDESFWTRASHCARLGSGSASRSVLPAVALWGATGDIPGSSDYYAVNPAGIDPVFETYHDTILIIDASEKAVKSTAGHALMNGHPYADQRFRRANAQLGRLIPAMRSGDMETFADIAESEALDLHAMMMTSSPSYLLMRPNTLSAIEKIRAFRKETGIPVCFTLDAGPNVHILYPGEHHQAVGAWIDGELKSLCAEGRMIHDRVGNGPVKLSQ